MGKNKEFLSSFIKEIDNDELIITEDNIVQQGTLESLLLEYEKVIVRSLVTSFGLDFLLFKDKRGGDVQTLHNARNGVFSDNKYKEQYEEVYDRKKYEDVKAMIDYKRKLFKNEEKVYSGYTNRELEKNGSTHTEHIVSAAEYHRNDKTRLFQSESRRKEIINDEKNFTLLESNINQSKSDDTMEEFLNKKVKGQNEVNAERFGIDRIEAIKKYNSSKNYINRKIMYDEIKHYSIEVSRNGTIAAAKMGLRQCIGIIFAEIWVVIRDDLPKIVENLKAGFSLDKLLISIGNLIRKTFEDVKLKYKELLVAIKDGAISGFLSTLSSTIVNIFFTTAKSIGKILRSTWGSIIEALKILIFNPDNMKFGEKIKAVTKIISICLATLCGSIIQEAINKILPIIPILSDVIPLFIGTMVTGILTVSFMYFLDNSEIVKKIVNYLNQFRTREELTLEYFKEVNRKLNIYVSQLLSINLDEFEKEVDNFKKINDKLDLARSSEEFSEILYEAINSLGGKLQFNNFNEFDEFMKDKDSVLII